MTKTKSMKPKAKPKQRKAKVSHVVKHSRTKPTKRRLPLTTTARMDLARVTGLAKMLTLPHETAPARFPNFNSAKKTAVLHLTTSGSITQDPAIDAAQAMFVCRSPVAPVWTEIVPTTLSQFAAEYSMGLATSTVDPQVPIFPNSYAISVGTTLPPLGFWDNGTWVYIPRGWSVAFGALAFTGAGNMNINYSVMTKIGEPTNYSVAVAIAAGIGTATAADLFVEGWLRITSLELVGFGATISSILTCQVTAPVSPVPTMLPLFNCIESASFAAIGSQLRVNASSLLLTNTTAPLYKSGTVNAAQLDFSLVGVFSANNIINAVQDRNSAVKYVGPLEKGLYTFTVPDESSAGFDDYYPVSTPNLGNLFMLADATIVNAFYCQPNAGFSQTYQYVYDHHLEFITSSQIYNLGVSTISFDEYNMMLASVGSLVPFTENPTHWAALAALAKSALRHLVPYLAPAGHKLIDYAAKRAHGLLPY